MSTALKSEILNSGQLEKAILSALEKSGNDDFKGSPDPIEQQKEFAKGLADAIADGVAKGVQQYLLKNVTTQPTATQQSITAPAPGPVAHPHPVPPIPIAPIKMVAP